MSAKIYLVGTGSGSDLDITPRAVAAIRAAEVVIGHGICLQSVRPQLEGKLVIGEEMSPLKRSEIAVLHALKGETVAILSAGDPGIYAIAATFFGYIKDKELNLDIEIVAGITLASMAAARLGAPLGRDFATVSLADRASPWEPVKDRLISAAGSDYVLVIYNPVGKLGKKRLGEVCRLIMAARPPRTPVGFVSRYGGTDERRVITDLEKLPFEKIDPDTLIIIGNRQTYVSGEWMITPRPYLEGAGY